MTVPLHHAKASLRQQIRERLNALTSQQREAASREICSRLRQQMIWQSAGSILCFAPLPAEPDIWPLLVEALHAGKTVGLPRFSSESSGYVAGQVRDLERDIRIGRFQIREPAEACPELELSRFDLILVPGVAFDHQGRRLGRGQGYYDRWLKDVRRAMLCGVAFEEQLAATIPAEAHDIAVNCVVTPAGVFNVAGAGAHGTME
jgi:5-formyltetrahydrofolate cyclo-ligase